LEKYKVLTEFGNDLTEIGKVLTEMGQIENQQAPITSISNWKSNKMLQIMLF
jgi:hypothetical protein